jgi:hypothetical protein
MLAVHYTFVIFISFFLVSYDGGFGSRTWSNMMVMWLLLISMAVIGSSEAAGTRTTFAGNRLPDIVPGVPGVDYPVASRVPATLRFQCDQQDYPGFFADPETGCQVISPSILPPLSLSLSFPTDTLLLSTHSTRKAIDYL